VTYTKKINSSIKKCNENPEGCNYCPIFRLIVDDGKAIQPEYR
jgi:hypothetical protein